MKKDKSLDGWGRRLTNKTIPRSVELGLLSASSSAQANLRRAEIMKNQEVAQACRKVLRQIKAALATCEKYNGRS